jgi:hypothetical protein
VWLAQETGELVAGVPLRTEALHVIEPPGALAFVAPVTVAVYVIVPPKAGLNGEEEIEIVGVAAVTVTVERPVVAEVGSVIGRDEELLTPLKVTCAVYVPETAGLITQPYAIVPGALDGLVLVLQELAAPPVIFQVTDPVGTTTPLPVIVATKVIGTPTVVVSPGVTET